MGRKIKNVSCDYCDRKVVIEPVLQSHLLSRHFRADCERAITQIFDLTDGRCPLCPGRSWSWPGKSLNWSMFLHFSRKHRIAEGLTFSGNKLNQVGRSTLTSMVSTSLTYLIILVQFKQSSG